MMLTDHDQTQFRITRMVAYVLLLAIPMVCLILVYSLDMTSKRGGEYDMVLYILLLVAMVEPALAFLLEKMQVENYKQSKSPSSSPAQLFTSISIIKLALVESSYLFAMVLFLISGQPINALYFYPIGIIWSVIYWPRMGKFEQFLEKMEQP